MTARFIQTGNGRAGAQAKWLWLSAALVFVPFVAKRLLELGEHDYVYWLTVDYGARLVSLCGAFLVYRHRLLGPPPRTLHLFASLALVPVFLGLLIAHINFVDPILHQHFSFLALSRYPHIGNVSVKVVDLVLGLMLVAVSEEIVFRRILFDLLERKCVNRGAVVLLSSFIFGLMHVTYGIDHFLSTLISGMLFGLLYYLTGRIWTSMIVHYFMDISFFISH